MSSESATILTAVVFAVGIVLGLVGDSYIANAVWQKRAIAHHAAHYNGETAQFEWTQ